MHIHGLYVISEAESHTSNGCQDTGQNIFENGWILAHGAVRFSAKIFSQKIFARAQRRAPPFILSRTWRAKKAHTSYERALSRQDELEACGEVKTGNKAWLRRRLHAAIVRDHLTARQHVTRNLMRTRESGEGPSF